MPPELSELQERTAGADGTPRREAIRGRLAAHLALYRLSRYRPPRTPTTPSRPARRDPAETPEHDGAGPAQLAPRSDHGPSAPASADATEIDLPDVVWVSAGDGTRAPDDLEDSGSSPTSAIVLNQRAARRRQSDDLIALLIDEPGLMVARTPARWATAASARRDVRFCFDAERLRPGTPVHS